MPEAKLDFSSALHESFRTFSGCEARNKHSFPFLSIALDHGPSGQRCHEYPSYCER